MGIYVIGDIHGCYTQFMELKSTIEEKDSDAQFILVGDIIDRGAEDEAVLAWAYENVTADGKYQMVLGNHDDKFIEVFGRGEFETLYSLRKELRYSGSISKSDFAHLQDKDLMYQYAEFLSKQPLYKKLEVAGQKYIIVHAWYTKKIQTDVRSADEEEELETFYGDKKEIKIAHDKRFDLIWERDREYDGVYTKGEYEPLEGEILIHGHSPTLATKDRMHRGYSPGKVWKRKNSVNVDCGLVFHVTIPEHDVYRYGNLAAYNIETGEAIYLWDIEDEYVTNDEDYYEDQKVRWGEYSY